jgi:hypothetical protein
MTNMRTTVLQYALTAGLSGMLALGAVTGSFGEARTGTGSTSQLAQYCAPDQGSDATNAPRIYCREGQG